MRTRLLTIACLLTAFGGCAGRWSETIWSDPELAHYKAAALHIEEPFVENETPPEHVSTPPPIVVGDEPPEYWELSLDEIIQLALAHSDVLRDLGGLILQSPESVVTQQSPAITESDPRFGVEAALSAFDAQFEGSLFFENNDRALNNVFFGGGTRLLKQDLHSYQFEVAKTAATGGRFALRKIIDYDFNNSPGNADPNLPWTAQIEGEFRQPLLQGAGVDFNQVAGPNSAPGVLNGVLLARISSDVSLADFELAIRDLVYDVENAYWELYYAYRDLDAKVAARDRALQTWRVVHDRYTTARRGGEAEREAQALEQYHRFEEQALNALVGRPHDRIRTTLFRGLGGVHVAERRLRLLAGLPVTDGRLIRPNDQPSLAKVIFDWEEALVEALGRRAELRRQKWQVARRELELAASHNFLLPRVDLVGRLRFRGLGHNLLNPTRQGRFDNAVQDLTTGDFQEWALGVEVAAPAGYRREHAALRNAELQLARELDLLRAQEEEVIHDLSAAFAEAARAYQAAQTNANRRMAALQQVAALESKYQDADEMDRTRLLDALLDAQQRLADAEVRFHRAAIEHTLAVRSVHLNKGSLLEYNQVYLAEGPWPAKAYQDAETRGSNRLNPPRALQSVLSSPPPISRGLVPQRIEPE